MEGIHYSASEQIISRLNETKKALEQIKEGQRTILDVAEWKPKFFQTQSKHQKQYLGELLEVINERFDKEEVITLCFQLDIEYDDLPAEGNKNKIRELIKFLHRHQRISELIQICKFERPDIVWDWGVNQNTDNLFGQQITDLRTQNQDLILQNFQYFEFLNRNFTRFWNHYLMDIKIEFPSLLLLVGENNVTLNLDKPFENDYIVKLICQYPVRPHLVSNVTGYKLQKLKIESPFGGNQTSDISISDSWLAKINPWLNRLREFLHYIPTKVYFDEYESDFISQIQTSIKIFDNVEMVLGRERTISTKNNRITPNDSEDHALHVLFNFLKQVDRDEKWCGLRKVITDDGNILWLCEKHRKIYEAM